MSGSHAPSLSAGGVSIIVEWENATRIGAQRAARMLATLRDQLSELDLAALGGAELLILYSVADGAPATIDDALTHIGELGVACRLVPTDTGDYYQQKNNGAKAASGDVLVFVDSDVIPRERWLSGLLEPMRDPTVALVGGATTIDRDDWYSSALALVWIFPLPRYELVTQPSTFFYANNFAVRRSVMTSNPFPDTGQYRGQCSVLADRLVQTGHDLRMNHRALVGHPPPPPGDLLQRGYRSGADLLGWLRTVRSRGFAWQGTKIVAHDLLAALSRVHAHRRAVGLGPGGAVAAGLMALFYNGARYVGFGWALLLRR